MEKSGRHQNIYVYLESMAQGLAKEVKEFGLALATFSSELKGMRETVNQLSRIVKDGNGQPSLVTKVAMAEKSIDDMSVKIDDMARKFEEARESGEFSKTLVETNGQRTAFWASVISGILGLVATALSLLK